MVSKEFVLGGKATLTIENAAAWASQNAAPAHFTFKINKKELDGDKSIYFVSLLTGPDNTRSYSYVGVLNVNSGVVHLTAKSKVTAETLSFRILNRVLSRIWANETSAITNAGFEVHHSGRCGKCGRKLTVPESVKTGFGPECRGNTKKKEVINV